MTPEELEAWAEDFEAFHARFAHLFARSEPRGSVPVKCKALRAEIQPPKGALLAQPGGLAPGGTDKQHQHSRGTLPSGEWWYNAPIA